MRTQTHPLTSFTDRRSIVFAPEHVGLKTRAQVQQGEVVLQVGPENDWTNKFPTLVKALKKLQIEDAILEGEIVWINEDGDSDMQQLRRALKNRNSTGLIFYVSDILELNQKDLRNLSLSQRRQKLEKLLRPLQATAVLFDEQSFLLSHPSKLIYAEERLSKWDVADYYRTVAPWMVPHLSGRPLTLVRCPRGTDHLCFYQKHSFKQTPAAIQKIRIQEKQGIRDSMTVDSVFGVEELVQLGCLEFHNWNCRWPRKDHPDQMVFDLDPDPELGWHSVARSALELQELLENLKVKSFVKLSGSKGIHVHVPLQPALDWLQVKRWALSVAQVLVRNNPRNYTLQLSKATRRNKILIDIFRNAAGATVVTPYSLRSRKRSSVAMPLEWGELESVGSAAAFSLEEALKKISVRKKDPWKDFFSSAQKLTEFP